MPSHFFQQRAALFFGIIPMQLGLRVRFISNVWRGCNVYPALEIYYIDDGAIDVPIEMFKFLCD
jgi:hypothetical protein